MSGNTSQSDASSEELFSAYGRTQDVISLERVLRDHLDQAYAMARRILGNGADAEDAVQEALTRLVRTASTYDGSIPFPAWLGQLVRQASLRVRRARLHRAKRERATEPLPEPEPRHATDAERVDALRRAIDALPERYREPIELHYFGGLSQEETARVLGVKEDAIAQRIHRARERIRARLGREGLSGVALLAALDAPPPLTAVHAPAHLLQGALKPAAPAAQGLAWAMAGAVGSLCIVTAIVIVITVLRQTSPGSAASQPAAVLATAPPVHQGPFGAWTFDDDLAPANLSVLRGSWHREAAGGTGDSGCMRIDSDQFAAEVAIPIARLPILVSCRIRNAGAGSVFIRATWSDVAHDSPDAVDQAFDAVEFHFMPTLADLSDWSTMSSYLSARAIDTYTKDQRESLVAIRPSSTARLVLSAWGRCLIDDLRVEEVATGDIPQTEAFLKALAGIPPARRHGRVEILDAHLPGMEPVQQVWLEFPKGFSDSWDPDRTVWFDHLDAAADPTPR